VIFLPVLQYGKYFKRNINTDRILTNQYQTILIGISDDGGILKENKFSNKNGIQLKKTFTKNKYTYRYLMLVILLGSYLSANNGKMHLQDFFSRL